MLWLSVTVIAGLAGPFGTFVAMSLPTRFGYWGLVVASAIFIVVFVRLVYLQALPNLRYVWISLLVSLTLTAILTPLILVITSPLARLENGHYVTAPYIALVIFVVAISVDLARYALEISLRKEAVRLMSDPEMPRLMTRLPKEIVAPILHINARDHLVNVRTEIGSCQIRLRLKDAIAEMEGVTGICTHRSHWVALSAVVGNADLESRPVLVLRDGTQVPVSRKYAPGVDALGMLDAGFGDAPG